MQHVLNALDKIHALLGRIAGMHPMGGQMHGYSLQTIAADIAAAKGEYDAAVKPREAWPTAEDAALDAIESGPDHGHKRRGRPRKRHA